jgi:hypothetical protein
MDTGAFIAAITATTQGYAVLKARISSRFLIVRTDILT